MVDRAGEKHEFHFQMRLLGNIAALDAFELRDESPAGYRFQVVGHPGDDALVLLGRLIEKMRRALSMQHLTDGEYGLQIADRTVRGRIEWDDSAAERTPLIVVESGNRLERLRPYADDVRGMAVQAGHFRPERRTMMAVRRNPRGLSALLR